MTKRQRKKALSLIIAIIICIGASFGLFYEDIVQPEGRYEVVRVIDGDTLVINYDGEKTKVRLIGIDTEESVHPNSSKNTVQGDEASQYTKSLLEGKNIELEFDKEKEDRYGRLLAYVYVDDNMVNEILLKEGYAEAKEYPPNTKYADTFKALENEAKSLRKGQWQ